MDAVNLPFQRAFIRDVCFVPAQEKRSPRCAVGRLHLDQALAAGDGIEGKNVVTGCVAFFLRHPPYLGCKVMSCQSLKTHALDVKHECFPRFPEFPVEVIPLHRIEFPK